MRPAMRLSRKAAKSRKSRLASSTPSVGKARAPGVAYGLVVLTLLPSQLRERRDSDVNRVRLSRAGSPIADQAAGRDGTEPTDERRRTQQAQCEALARPMRLGGARAPRRQELRRDDVREPEADRREFQCQEGVADVLAAVRREQRDAARGRDRETASGQSQRGSLENRERHTAPQAEQPQVEDE